MKKRYRFAVIALAMGLILAGCQAKPQEKEDPAPAPEADTKQEAEPENLKSVPKEEVSDPCYIAEGIRRAAVTKDGEELLEVSYEPKDYEGSYQYWKIRIPYGEEAVVDTEAMLALYHQLETLDFQQEVKGADQDTGLEGTKTEITLEFCQTNQEERDAALKDQAYEGEESPSYQPQADSTCTLLVGKQDGQGKYYTALKNQPEKVYMMPEQSIDAILKVNPYDLIIKVSAVAPVETVDQVVIGMDGKEYQLTRQDDGGLLDKKKLGEKEYYALYSELLSVLIAGEVEDEQKLTDEVLLSLDFTRNTGAQGDLKLSFHAYDDTFASVEVNGIEKFLVKNDDILKLKDVIKSHL